MEMEHALMLEALAGATQTGLTLARVVARWSGVRGSNDVQEPADTYTNHGPAGSAGATSTDGRVSTDPNRHDQPA